MCEFISKNDMTNPEIRSSPRIRVRLLWTTAETVRGLHFLRLYLGEAQAPEPLKEQQKEYQEAQSQGPFNANQFLITMSLNEIDVGDPRLPQPGNVITFTPTKLRLYRNCCQVDSKLQNITVVNTT